MQSRSGEGAIKKITFQNICLVFGQSKVVTASYVALAKKLVSF